MSKPDTANLEDGFYWVRMGETWCVGVLKAGFWLFVDHNQAYGIAIKPDEIDPRLIKREPQP